MLKYITISILPLVLAMCTSSNKQLKLEGYDGSGGQQNQIVLNDSYEAEESITENETDPIPQPNITKKKIIKDGNMAIKVDDIYSAKQKVDSLVNLYKAYYAKENLNNSDYNTSYNLKIRIPSKYFEVFIARLEDGTGEVLYKNLDARDVTDQFIDIETRLENKRKYLKQYQQLLKRANTIKEILEIEERIRALEEEIESSEGQLKYLSNQVAYSTLNLELTKQKDYVFKPKKRTRFIEKLKQSLSGGWYGFVTFFLFMVRIWPFWIIVTVGFYLIKRYRRKRKFNKQS